MVGSGSGFVFSDGHGLAYFTNWYDDLTALDAVDWNLVGARYWADQPDDNDRQRRKQAEFLVRNSLDWSLIQEIVVYDDQTKAMVDALLLEYPERSRPPVSVCDFFIGMTIFLGHSHPWQNMNCHPDRSEAKWRDLLFPLPASNARWQRHPSLCHPERSRGICGSLHPPTDASGSTAGVLRLRATSAVTRHKSVKRSGQRKTRLVLLLG